MEQIKQEAIAHITEELRVDLRNRIDVFLKEFEKLLKEIERDKRERKLRIIL